MRKDLDELREVRKAIQEDGPTNPFADFRDSAADHEALKELTQQQQEVIDKKFLDEVRLYSKHNQ
jgi:hypothetical protein